MKKVLFTTTAALALSISCAAFADVHAGFSFSGTTKIGFNSDNDAATTDDEGGIFMDTDIDISASKSIGDYEIGAKAELDADWDEEDAATVDTASFGFDSAYVDTPIGKLTWSESADEGSAADLFYVDRDGQAEDVADLDGIANLLWEGNVGQFEYAIGTGSLEDGSSSSTPAPTNADDWSIGLGTALTTGAGDIDLGLGYVNNDGAGNTQTGVSADFGLGMASVGLSYLTGAQDTFGVKVGVDVTPELSVAVYYADNSAADNEYGAFVDYASGPFSIGFDYHTGDGAVVDNFEVDASYDTGAGATVYAGYDDASGESYVGAEVDIADGITGTVAWSDGHEVGGPEFTLGTSAFITIKY